ncbi:MAG TPA: hypothetical protein VN748_03995 [Pseudonocardiaceae bacterium]|nr:hypothetical protein [Pseudonocardiaceae bacterium]
MRNKYQKTNIGTSAPTVPEQVCTPNLVGMLRTCVRTALVDTTDSTAMGAVVAGGQ